MSKSQKVAPNAQKADSVEREKDASIGGTISSLSKDTVSKVGDAFRDMGVGMFDQLIGRETLPSKSEYSHQEPHGFNAERGTVFSFRDVEEERQISEIKELIQAIKQEVENIKRADKALMSEVADIEGLTINSLPEKPGIYHVRFLEIVLKVLQALKLKINESGTWMEALRTKKAKRGSAFMANSKKKGTQYSMSQEHQVTRSVQ